MNQKPTDDSTQDENHEEFSGQSAPAFDEQEQQIAELTAALQRERADAENLRRRHGQQVAQMEDAAKANVVRQLLPVIDNVERALAHTPEDLKGNDFVKGVQGVAKQFASVLEKLGVKRIPTVGQPFDPHLHEAVSAEEGEGAEEVVSEELQPGYQIGGQVIRHAMVKVRT